MSSGAADSELLARTAAGDHTALAELYDRYSSKVNGLALKVLRNQEMAEDALQETFLRVWRKADLFSENKGPLLPWLLAICRNICIDKIRARKSQESKSLWEKELYEQIAQREGALTHVEGVDLAEQIEKALLLLEPIEQRIVEMAYFAGQTQAEISQTLAMPLGTVKTKTRAALRKMREALGNIWDPRNG